MKIIDKLSHNSTTIIAWVVDFSNALEEFTIISSEGNRIETGCMNTVQPQNHLRVSVIKDGVRQYDLSRSEAIALGVTENHIALWKQTINQITPILK